MNKGGKAATVIVLVVVVSKVKEGEAGNKAFRNIARWLYIP